MLKTVLCVQHVLMLAKNYQSRVRLVRTRGPVYIFPSVCDGSSVDRNIGERLYPAYAVPNLAIDKFL